MTKLIALAVIAAGVIAADAAEVASGSAFEVPPEVAEPLLTQGLAKLADEPLSKLKAKAVKLVKARVLVDGYYGRPDDVIELPAADIEKAEASGQVDSNEAAVAYASLLDQNQAA